MPYLTVNNSSAEYWGEKQAIIECCQILVPAGFEYDQCPSCNGTKVLKTTTPHIKYWFWYCFPGCTPDSDVFGPYDSEEEVIEAIKEDSE